MSNTRKLWIGLISLLVVAFAVLLIMGGEIYRKAPPVPERVVANGGDAVYTRADIELGRQVWQSMGGMQLGSVWGHGGYVAPDWSADWVHREAVALLDIWAKRTGGAESFSELGPDEQAALTGRLKRTIRTNTYDPQTRDIVLDADRAAAIARVADHYERLFGHDAATAELREAYAMKDDRARILAAGFDAYLSKPVDVRALPAQVEALLK